jgi:DNA invertase Pin-like site-specific DNA recombinase
MIIGYARVSTRHQTTDGQLDALTAAGAERIFTDVMSGGRDDRPGLAQMLDMVRAGDVVIVVALDRLGRSLPGIIKTVATLTERGVILRSQRESIDTGTAVGEMLVGIFGALAQYERTLIAERAEVAREAARTRGRQVGRPRAITADQLRAVQAMRSAGEPMSSICATLGLRRSTVYKALSEIGDEAAA